MRTRTSATSTTPLRAGWLTLLLGAATLAFAPQPARAAQQLPFAATFTTTFESVLAFPILNVTVTGQGPATHLGLTTTATTATINVITGALTGTNTLTGANGATLVMELDGQTTLVPGGSEFEGTYVVTGGTGRFEGATGEGTFSGSNTFTGPNNGVGSAAFAGTVSRPGGGN